MANRTLQFHGLAYGDVPVQINAHINGQLVFTGAVPTVSGDPPLEPVYPTPVLFSVVESALFPTSFSGAYPMTISVATGYAIDVNEVRCNYMQGTNSADVYLVSYTGIPANEDQTTDCRSTVTLDGMDEAELPPGAVGQKAWRINAGSTLGCNFNTSVGYEAAP